MVTADTKAKPSTTPKHVEMSVIDHNSCLHENPQFEFIASDRTFFAKAEGEAGPCLGDSGSGFYVKHGSMWFIEGITSSSLTRNGDCDVTKSAVFTRLSNFTDWINENTGSSIPTDDQSNLKQQSGLKLQSNSDHDYKRIHLNPTQNEPSIGDMWEDAKKYVKWFG